MVVFIRSVARDGQMRAGPPVGCDISDFLEEKAPMATTQIQSRQLPGRPLARRSVRRSTVLAAVLALLTTLLVAAPASAATVCASPVDDGTAILNMDDAGGDPVVLSMSGGVIFVDGEACGTAPTSPFLTVIDTGEAKTDHLIIDLAQPFRIGTQAVTVQVRLDEGEDIVTVRGAATTDIATLTPQFLSVGTGTVFPGSDNDLRLQMSMPSTEVDLRVNLRGGNDSFNMRADGNDAWYDGPLKVKGQAGNDVLRGGPGRQRMFGGKGRDTLIGRAGDDRIQGGPGRDTLNGGSGDDDIRGGGGEDMASGKSGRDSFRMRDGDVDTVLGGKGRDSCICDASDTMRSIRDVTT